MSKLVSLHDAIAAHVRDGDSVCMGCQMEHAIPFAAGHEIMRQHRRELRLIGPISDILFDQMIAAGCARDVVAAWVGNVMMGSAYGFRRAYEGSEWAAYEEARSRGVSNPTLPLRSAQGQDGAPSGVVDLTLRSAQDGAPGEKPVGFRVFNMSNFTVSLALQAGAMGVPFLPTRSVQGSDIAKNNHFYYQVMSPFANERGEREMLMAVRAINPDVTIVQVQRADEEGNAHCWANLGILLEAVRAAKKVIVCAEEIVEREVIASDPNRTVIPGFLATAVCEVRMGAHPSPVQGYYSRDNEYFREYHLATKTAAEFDQWAEKWVYGVRDRREYLGVLGERGLGVKEHAWAAGADFGY